MKNKTLIGTLLVCVFLANAMVPVFSADTLLATDFTAESFSKTIDFFDYARAYALLHGMNAPPDDWHAYMYMNYVNTTGLKLLYAGLTNVSFGGAGALTIPMQTFMMYYKTNNRSRDVLLAETFLMLLAFNETGSSIYSGSPDRNDTLWASFSLGFDFSVFNASLPALNSKTEIIPLSHSDDKLHWTWGMRYTNLTAIWWRTWVLPNNHTFNSSPVAIATYDELTFSYNLTIDPDAHTATLTENHVIGRIRELVVFWEWLIIPLFNRYNSTGCYGTFGNYVSNETVYDFIEHNQIKMSIVNFQTSILADHETVSRTPSGQNVTDTDVSVSDSNVTTFADDGEKIFDASFGTKQNYKLFNYTADPTETEYSTYDSTARTSQIGGFAQNTGLFQHHINLMKFLPLLVVSMYPGLYARAKETISNMSRANYFYLIGYPEYSGFRVEHDPTFTAYLAASAAPVAPPNWGGVIVIGVIATIIVGAAVVLVKRRKPKQLSQSLQPPAPPQPPTS